MPWRVEHRGKSYVVVNAETGDVKGTHPTRAAANAQLRALYANTSAEMDAAYREAKKSK